MAFFAEPSHRKRLELLCMFAASEHAAYRGDPERIRQILMNLLSNAIKFTEQGQVAVKVRSEPAGTEQAVIRVEVEDTGIGIRAEHQRHIFDAFAQADGSTTRKYGGTGLGLAICTRLATLMEGSIGVQSEVGRGSRFWFTVTLKREPAESVACQPPPDVVLKAIRILVVDDNDTNREILTHQLAAWGIQHDCAGAAEEASRRMLIAVRQNRPYDIVILDREMPEMDGVTLAKQIKSDSELQGVRVIMLSSVNQLTETGQWFTMGIDLYLNKPVRQVELLDAILTVTRGEPAKSAPGKAKAKAELSGPAPGKFNGHVLLAEDNSVNQELAQAMLKGLGLSVTLVANGREAVEAVTGAPFDRMQRAYDVILMDCQMPDMDGYDASRKIRDWEACQDAAAALPIVALTANAMAGDRERCLAAGMSDYLSKPFSQEQLAAILARWLPLAATAPMPVATSAEAPREPRRKAAGTALDQTALDNIRALSDDGNPDLLGRIIGLFLKEAPALVERMRGAVQSGDAKDLRMAAHTLKSSSANLGAMKLAALCKDLERIAAENRMQDSAATFNVLEFEFDGACAALAHAKEQQVVAA